MNSTQIDVLFVQDCSKTTCGPIGYKIDTINTLKPITRELKNRGYSIGFINLVNITITKDKKPTKEQVNGCNNFFITLLQKYKPKIIVALGSIVTNQLTGKTKFKEWVGRRIEIGEYVVIPIYHPDYAVKSKQRKREYDSHVANIIPQIVIDTKKVFNTKYVLLQEEDQIIKCLYWLRTEKIDTIQSFDYETTHLIPYKGDLVCLSISYSKNQAFCLYFFDIDEYAKYKKNSRFTPKIKNAIKEWMLSPLPKVAQNAKFEIKWTKQHIQCEPNNIVGDTKQIHHLINEDTSDRLTDLAYQYTDRGGYDMPMQEWLDDGNEHWQAPPKFMLPYAAGDSDVTRQIYIKQIDTLNQEKGIRWLYNNIVHPSILTLARIEHRGMKIDVKRAVEVDTLLDKKINEINSKIEKMPCVKNTLEFVNKNKKGKNALTNINLNSPVQVQHLLYSELRLPVLSESKKTGSPSTDSTTLELLRHKHSVVDLILKLRSYVYQKNDLSQIMSKLTNNDTVFSDLVQDYVVTGRLSSRDPNLQNIKNGTEDEPSYVKECFISRFDNGVIMQADQGQLELRLVGSEANEPKFKRAFRDDIDMHSMTGAEIHDIDLKEFLDNKEKYKPERLKGKRINFGSVYGITEYGLSKQLSMTVKEAKQYLNKYWEVYAPIKIWMKENIKEAEEEFLVRSRLGRIRHLPDILSSKWWLREAAQRMASNFKIQSLGADINMWTMVIIDKMLIDGKYKSMIIGQIHDSILLDVHPDEITDVANIAIDVMEKRTMELFTFLNIDLLVDVEMGDRWSNLKKYGEYK